MNRIQLIRTLVALSSTELARPSGTAICVPGGSYSPVTPRRGNDKIQEFYNAKRN